MKGETIVKAVLTILSIGLLFLVFVRHDISTPCVGQHCNNSLDSRILNSFAHRPKKVKPTVNLAVVACGDRLEEAVTLLKSAIIFGRDVNLNIIAFVDDRTNLSLPEESLLRNLDSVMYIDSDTIFLSNVLHFWDKFSEMEKTNRTIAAMAAEHELPADGWYNLYAGSPYYGARGLNAGVMLMNLTQFRELKVEETIFDIYKQFKDKITWADQDLLNVYFHDFPSLMHELSCDFNYRVQHCDCQYKGDCSCKSADSHGISIIHGNRNMFHLTYRQFKFANYIFNAFKLYNLETDTPHQLYQTLEQEHENLQKNKEGGGPCDKLIFKNIFKKFKSYLDLV